MTTQPQAVPAAPTLTTPVGVTGTAGYTFQWTPDPGGGAQSDAYFQLANAGGTVIIDRPYGSGILGTAAYTVPYGVMANGQTYQFRVSTSNPSGSSPFSAYLPFKVDYPPTVNIPGLPAQNQTQPVVLPWTFSAAAGEVQTYWAVQIDDVTAGNVPFNYTALTAGAQTSYTQAAGTMLGNRQYRYRVLVQQTNGGQSPWSPWSYFNTYTAPAAPTLAQPPATLDGRVANTFTWTFQPTMGGQTQGSFDFQLYRPGDGVTVVDTGWVAAGAGGYTLAAGAIVFNTAYLWRVITRDQWGQQSPWSAWSRQFIGDTSPTAPLLAAVANFDAVAGTTVSWTFTDPDTPSGDYQTNAGIQVFDMTAGGTMIANIGGLGTAQSYVFVGSGAGAGGIFTNGHAYQWQVHTVDILGQLSPWSAVGSFSCVALATPPLLTTFAGVDATQASVLSWTFRDPDVAASQSDANVEVWDVTGGGNTLVAQVLFGGGLGPSTSWGIVANTYTNGHSYQWRARTRNSHTPANQSDWSAWGSFSCAAAPGCTIVFPPSDGYVHGQTSMTVQWQTTGIRPQAQFQAQLFSSGGTLLANSGVVSSAATSYAFAYTLVTANTYVIRVQTWNDFGSASPIAVRTFVVQVSAPAPVVLTATPNPAAGLVQLSWTAPALVPGQTPVASYQVNRRRAVPTLYPAQVAWDSADPRTPPSGVVQPWQLVHTLSVLATTESYVGYAGALWLANLLGAVGANVPRYEPGRFGPTSVVADGLGNLVSNGTFDTNITGWAAGGPATLAQVTNQPGQTGTGCLGITQTAGGGYAQTALALGGSSQAYRISADIYLPAGIIGYLQLVDINQANAVKQAQTLTGTGAWQHLGMSTPVPYQSNSYFLRVFASGGAGTIYVDNVSCVTTQNAVDNPDFEASGLTQWAAYGSATLALSTTTVSAGTRSLQVTPTGANGGASALLNLAQPVSYQAALDVWAPVGQSFAVFLVDPWGAGLAQTATIAGTGAWQRVVLPLGVATATNLGSNQTNSATLRIQATVSGTPIYIDQVVVNRADLALRVEDPTQNLCTNPLFDANTTGWAVYSSATMTRSYSAAGIVGLGHGWYLDCVPSAGFSGVAYAVALTSGQTYTWSCWLWSSPGAQIYAQINNPPNNAAFGQVLTTTAGGWQQVSGSFTANQTGTWNFIAQCAAAAQHFAIGAVQIQPGTKQTAFYDQAGGTTAQYVTVPSAGLVPPLGTPFTWEGYFYAQRADLTGGGRVFIDAMPRFMLYHNAAEPAVPVFAYQDGTGATQSVSAAAVANLAVGWHYFAVVFDGSTVSLRIDQTQVLSVVTNLPAAWPATIYFGQSRTGSNSANGLLARFRLSSVARLASECNANAVATTAIQPDATTLGLWTFNGAIGHQVLVTGYTDYACPGTSDGSLAFEYQVTTIGTDGTQAQSNIVRVALVLDGVWIYDVSDPAGSILHLVNTPGPRGWQSTAHAAMQFYDGRQRPVAELDGHVERTYHVGAFANWRDPNYQAVQDLVARLATYCLRDQRGRQFYGVVPGFGFDDETHMDTYTLQLSEVDYTIT